MLEIALGSALIYYFATEAFEIEKKPPGTVYYTETADSRNLSFHRNHTEPVTIKPAVEDQFRGIVRQAYDYSCGSAALTTLLNGYVGTSLTEQQTMSGLLQYGEYQRIIERRSFSLLDMKRFVTAIGLESGGYRGEFSDLVKLGQPAIVPISYAGFKHFVVYKAYKDGRVYVADPALGNISFDENRFKEIWDNNT
ncbi:TPA: C39 family peptidase, partial [Acinetobacter baumannii]|nr:C39 family peptidase [Acinetobacter baumannii]